VARSTSLNVMRRQRSPPHQVPGRSAPGVRGEAAAVAHSDAASNANASASCVGSGRRGASIGGFVDGRQRRSEAHVSQPRPEPQPLRARALRSGGRRDSDAAARFLRQAHPNAA
jgi:hypothetical protein